MPILVESSGEKYLIDYFSVTLVAAVCFSVIFLFLNSFVKHKDVLLLAVWEGFIYLWCFCLFVLGQTSNKEG